MESASCQATHAGNCVTDIALAPFLEVMQSLGRDDEGLTMTEWREKIGVGELRMKRLMGEAIKQGKATAGKRLDTKHWSGVPRTFTVYKWKE